MGYVEDLGVGRRTLLKYGPAYFDGRDVAIEEDDVFRITIPYKPTIFPVGAINGGITEGEKLALGVIRTYPGNRVPYLSNASGIPERTLERFTSLLREKGLIEYKGLKRTGGYYPLEP